METHLHQELNMLRVQLMEMFAQTEKALDKAIESLLKRDDDLAQQVIEGDQEINKMEVEMEERILNILALWQPVAKDLRFITAASRIANDLERVGDQATNIAERAIMLNQKPRLDFMNSVQALAEVAMNMYRNIIDAFANGDVSLAANVCKMDSKADDLNIRIIKRLIDYMANETVIVERAVHTIIVANALERIGDLATNIGEDVVFIKKGINVRHSNSFDSVCFEDIVWEERKKE